MGIAENISAIKATLLDGVRLIAVSKFHPAEAIAEAYEAGNGTSAKPCAGTLSQGPVLPDDIHWHFIGICRPTR